MKATRRTCILDGFLGPKEAVCKPDPEDKDLFKIASNDQEIIIRVNSRKVESRFGESSNPTFYYS